MSDLFDSMIQHQVRLERAKAGESIAVNKLIKVNDKKIISLISSLPENYTQAQINSLIKKINKLNKVFYSTTVLNKLEEVAKETVAIESKFAAETVDKFFDGITSKNDLVKTNKRVLSEPFEGDKLSTWVKKLGKDKSKRIEREIRKKALDNSSFLTESKRAITTANNSNKAITNSYINQATNFSRDDVYLKNDDKVKIIIWSTILDAGTTLTCAVRSNKKYHAITKQPIGHSELWNGGPSLIHWGCRSIGIPTDENGVITSGAGAGSVEGTGSKTAIGPDVGYKRGDNLNSKGKRYKIPTANNNLDREMVSGKTDYETWLKRQPKAFIQDTLGPVRSELFRSGKLNLGDFVTEDGTEILIKDLNIN